MTDTANQLERIASRAIALYSRPTVAMELVRLAEEPRVDAQRLKDCVAQDPALTCKILRVVNSSLFGLNRPVADLNQAIGLLGIKPLKLLVLGFSLPDALFAEVAARELRWYWTNTLTRAVAARLLAEQLWNQPGDEAFIAGLLQDIGILVLLRELGELYARFLTGVIEEKCHLASLEHDTLGFDHIQLGASLLARWQLPQRLVDAIAMPKRSARLARMESPQADLPQILHLAEMLMQLVGQGRLHVLPDLLEAGKVYRGMTKSKLASLVEGLQTQVDQLGQVLSLELTDERDYKQTLLEAHRQMAALSEQIAGEPSRGSAEESACASVLASTSELSRAMQSFLGPKKTDDEHDVACREEQHAAHPLDGKSIAAIASGCGEATTVAMLARKLVASAICCRDHRHELSLIIMEPHGAGARREPTSQLAIHQARRALASACAVLEQENVAMISLSDRRTAAIISNCERRAALAVAQNAIAEFAGILAHQSEPDGDAPATLSIGVATASVVPKNFDPTRMIERAARCLSAARACGTSAVKSIEV
ncbi:MAG: HDOD domain-containing protein [Planctomycetes bacterium]|nr:HDOD domain-containing protein [Planctomycetota bacterium]